MPDDAKLEHVVRRASSKVSVGDPHVIEHGRVLEIAAVSLGLDWVARNTGVLDERTATEALVPLARVASRRGGVDTEVAQQLVQLLSSRLGETAGETPLAEEGKRLVEKLRHQLHDA